MSEDDGGEDGYRDRIAIHADLPREDIPDGIDVVDPEDEPARAVEIMYIRDRQEYETCVRYARPGSATKFIHGVTDTLTDAIQIAIDQVSMDYPLLGRVYAYDWVSEIEGEPGSNRIPRPWSNDEDEENGSS